MIPMFSQAPPGIPERQKETEYGLYIGQLSPEITEEILYHHFKLKNVSVIDMKGLTVVREKEKKISKGFAFAYFNSQTSQIEARELLLDTEILGCKIQVALFKRR